MKTRVTTALSVMLVAGWLGGCGGEQPGAPATTSPAGARPGPDDCDDREEHDQPDLRVGTQGR